jgi:hypothetical protein
VEGGASPDVAAHQDDAFAIPAIRLCCLGLVASVPGASAVVIVGRGRHREIVEGEGAVYTDIGGEQALPPSPTAGPRSSIGEAPEGASEKEKGPLDPLDSSVLRRREPAAGAALAAGHDGGWKTTE